MKFVINHGLILLGLVLPCALLAQSTKCEPLSPLPGSTSQYKDRGNRCEGFYVADVGIKSIELISFTEGRLSYELKPGVKLQVSTPTQTGQVHVRALAKPPKTYYRMDTTLEGSSVLIWPVDDVLSPEGLSADRIGVFAWKGSGDNRIFVPVRVTAGSSGTRLEPLIYLSVRPSFDVETMKWRSAAVNHGICSPFGAWENALRQQALAGQPVTVSLKGLKGEHCIEVAGRAENSNDWSTLTIRIELPGK